MKAKRKVKLQKRSLIQKNINEDLATGVSIESASYMENKADIKIEDRMFSNNEKLHETNLEEEYTPKLFSEEQNFEPKTQTKMASKTTTQNNCLIKKLQRMKTLKYLHF